MAISKAKVLKELKKRAAESERAAAAPAFLIEDFCFAEQLQFALEKRIIKSACTSHRAGKTNTIIADFVHTCLTENNVLCLYLTLTSR